MSGLRTLPGLLAVAVGVAAVGVAALVLLGGSGPADLDAPAAPATPYAPAAPAAPDAPATPGAPATPATPDAPTVPATPATAVTIVWAEGRIDDDVAATVAGAEGILTATRTRTAQTGLTGSVDADGTPRDVLAAGWRIPVTVIALEPAGWARHLDGTLDVDDLLALGRLAPGRVLLSERSARLRDVGVGGSVDVAGAEGLEVVGIVSDRASSGSEVVLHVDEPDVGWLGGRESLLLRHAADAGDALAAAVADAEVLAAAGTRTDEDVLRIFEPTPGPGFPIVLGHVAVKERFGEFAYRLVLNQREVVIDPAYVAEWIVKERLPVLGEVECHRLIMDDLRAAVDEVIAAGHEAWLSPRRYAGCFYPRRIGFGRETLSRHTWGIAVDIDVDLSLPGLGPVPDDEIIDIMGRHGFRWGGDFTTPDNHHWEWVGEHALRRPERPER